MVAKTFYSIRVSGGDCILFFFMKLQKCLFQSAMNDRRVLLNVAIIMDRDARFNVISQTKLL